MTISDLHKELLTAEGMKAAREAFAGQYEWFLHASREACFDPIKGEGLKPQYPNGWDSNVDFNEIVQQLGVDRPKIVCLQPKGAKLNTTPNRGDQQFMIAICGEDLPKRIGLHWSFASCFGRADQIRFASPNKSNEEIFWEVVHEYGCVASYDLIAPSVLRVRLKDSPEGDPTRWPRISDVASADLHLFGSQQKAPER